MPPSVSILMPAYNAEKFLAAAIDSVLAQSLPDWELIVCDDGSTDLTRAIVGGYQRDARVELVAQVNQGAAAARNLALRAARGAYLALLDADDMWPPDYLARMLPILKNDATAVAVYAAWQYI